MPRMKKPHWYNSEGSEQYGLDDCFEMQRELETPENPSIYKPDETQTVNSIFTSLSNGMSIMIEPKKNVEKISLSDDLHEKLKNHPREIMSETYLVNTNFPRALNAEILSPQLTNSTNLYGMKSAIFAQMSCIKAPQWYDFEASEQSGIDSYFETTGKELETPKNPSKYKSDETQTVHSIFTSLSNGMSGSIVIESKKNVEKFFLSDDLDEKFKTQPRDIMNETYLVSTNFPRVLNAKILTPQSTNSTNLYGINSAIFAQMSRIKAPQWYDFEASEQSGIDAYFETTGKELETPKNPSKYKSDETQTVHSIFTPLSNGMPSPSAIEPEKYFEKKFSSDNSHGKFKSQSQELTRKIHPVNYNLPFNDEIFGPQSIDSRDFYNENMTKKIPSETSNEFPTGNVHREYHSSTTPSTDPSIASRINRKTRETPPEMEDHDYSDLNTTSESLTKAMKNLCIRSEKQIAEVRKISLTPNTWKMEVETDAQTSMPRLTSKNEIVAKNIEARIKDQSIYSDEIKKFATYSEIGNMQVSEFLDKMQEENNNFVLEKKNDGDKKYFKSENRTTMKIISGKPDIINGEDADIEIQDGKLLQILAEKLENTGTDGENVAASSSSNITEFPLKGLSTEAKLAAICHKMVQLRDKKSRVLTCLKYRRQSGQFARLPVGTTKIYKDMQKHLQTRSKVSSRETQHNELTLTDPSSPTLQSKSRTKPIKFPNCEERERLDIDEIHRNCIKPNHPKPKKMKKKVTDLSSPISRCKSSTNSSKFPNLEKDKIKIEEIRQSRVQTNHLKPKTMKDKLIADSTSPCISATKAINPSLSPLEFQRSAKCTQKKVIVTKIVSIDEEVVGLKDEEIFHFGIPIGDNCRKLTPTKPFSFDVREKKIGDKTGKIRDEKKMAKKLQAGPASSLTAARTYGIIKNGQLSKVPIQRNVEKEQYMADGPKFQERNDILLEKKKKLVVQARAREKLSPHFQANPVPIFKPVMVRSTCSSRTLYSTKRTRDLSPAETIANKENRPPNASSTDHFAKLKIAQTTDNSKPKKTSPKPPILNADERVKRRRIFDAMIRQKDEEAKARRREEENVRLECEKRKEKELRKNMKRKARPMPIFKTPKIAKSLKPLTDPQSPAWAGRKLLS